MQKAHPDARREPLAARLDARQRPRALQDMLRRLEQAAARYFRGEPPGAGERLDDPGRAHAAQQRLIGEAGEGGAAVAVEDVLAARDLRPVDPVGDGVDFGPELVEFGVAGGVVAEEDVEVALGFGFGVFGLFCGGGGGS